MKRAILKTITVLVLSLTMGVILLSGCEFDSTVLKGRGEIQSYNFQTERFSGLNISGAYEIIFLQAAEYSIALEIQENLFQYVKTDVLDDVFYISSSRNFYTTTKNTPRLTISAPDLKSLDFSGAINANLDMYVDSLCISISGASEVILNGSAKTLDINNSGAAIIKAFNMISNDVMVSITGAGVVDVYASDTLDLRISGVGHVRYDGEPQLTQSISGMGSFEKRS